MCRRCSAPPASRAASLSSCSPRSSWPAAAARCAPTIPRSPRCWRRPARRRRTSASPRRRRRTRPACPGTDPTQTAAAIARAVFPDPARKPSAVTIVDATDWRVAVAASALMAAPFRAPILFSDGTSLPGAVEVRARRARADGLQGGRQRAGHPRRQRRQAGRLQVDRRPRRDPAGPDALDRGADPLRAPGRGVEDRHRQLRRPVVRDAGRGLRRQDRRPDPLRDEGRHPARDARARSPRCAGWPSRGSSSSARPSSSRRP